MTLATPFIPESQESAVPDAALATAITASASSGPTIWGLSIVQLHDRFWASRGVQVVRLGERSTIVDDAELFLLTDPRTLVMLRIREVVEKMVWLNSDLLTVRLRNEREAQYRE